MHTSGFYIIEQNRNNSEKPDIHTPTQTKQIELAETIANYKLLGITRPKLVRLIAKYKSHLPKSNKNKPTIETSNINAENKLSKKELFLLEKKETHRQEKEDAKQVLNTITENLESYLDIYTDKTKKPLTKTERRRLKRLNEKAQYNALGLQRKDSALHCKIMDISHKVESKVRQEHYRKAIKEFLEETSESIVNANNMAYKFAEEEFDNSYRKMRSTRPTERNYHTK
jgi:hypothetical protein